jgi:ferredoxin
MVTDQWHIIVNSVRCIGSGICASAAPEHFAISGDHSVPLREHVEPDEAVLDAADCCPMEAITIRNLQDGRTIAPLT